MGNIENDNRGFYRYYTSNGIVRAIVDNTLRWVLPCEENDPFEVLPSGWDLNAIKSTPDYKPGAEEFLDAIFQSKKVQRKISHTAAFVSFSREEKDMLMWTHYAERYIGACLEFDMPRLQKHFPQDEVTLRPVNYEPEGEARKLRPRFPISLEDPDGMSPESQKLAIAFLTNKAKEWTYEQEWRLIATPLEATFIKCVEVDKNYILVSQMPRGAIKRLIFGYNMPVSTRLALARQIRINHQGCKFAEVVPDRQWYELSIEVLEMEAKNGTANQP